MCEECGCGLNHAHGHEPDHEHAHPHQHAHQDQPDPGPRRVIPVQAALLAENDRQAERNRGFFKAHAVLALNFLSSPGAGKTALLEQTIRSLTGRLRAGVLVGDLATDNDAQRLRRTGAPVVQINTGTVCHLDAPMVARSLAILSLGDLDVLLIENVGNLVCPASFDLGEAKKIVLFSVTEGEDKPLKYPPIFQSANALVLTKTDLAQACDFDHDRALANLRAAARSIPLFETSSKNRAGFEPWLDYLVQQHHAYTHAAFGE